MDALTEGGVTFPQNPFEGGADTGKAFLQQGRHLQGAHGVEQVVRIAERVHVAHGAVHRRSRHFQRRDGHRRVDVAAAARQDARVARVLQQRRGVTALQFEAVLQVRVRFAESFDKARLRFGEMRIFRTFGEHGEDDVFAGNGTGEGAEIGRGGDDAQRGWVLRQSGTCCGAHMHCRKRESDQNSVMCG